MDDNAQIVEERHFAWNSLLQSNENPYVKMMILGLKPSKGPNFGTAGWFLRRCHFFQNVWESLTIFNKNASATTVS